jgi:hypothetical protein
MEIGKAIYSQQSSDSGEQAQETTSESTEGEKKDEEKK